MEQMSKLFVALLAVCFVQFGHAASSPSVGEEGQQAMVVASATLKLSQDGESAEAGVSVAVGDVVTIESSTENLLKVTLASGESGFVPSVSLAPKVSLKNGFCFVVSLEQALNSELFQSPEITGTQDEYFYGESLEFSASLAASVSAEQEICFNNSSPRLSVPTKWAGDEPPQRMAIAAFPSRQVVVSGRKVSISLEAFCLDEEKRAPSKSDYFSLTSTADFEFGPRQMAALSDSNEPYNVQQCLWLAEDQSLHSTTGVAERLMLLYTRRSEAKQGKEYLTPGVYFLFLAKEQRAVFPYALLGTLENIRATCPSLSELISYKDGEAHAIEVSKSYFQR